MKGKDNSHSLAFKNTKARPSETCLFILEGWIGNAMGKGKETQHNGTLLVTNERVCFYRKGFLGEVFETMPYEKISSIETKSLMGYRVITLHTVHDQLSFKTFERKELFAEVHEAIEQTRNRSRDQGVNSTPAQPSAKDRIVALQGLLSDGVIDQEEFETQRQRILQSI